MVRRAPGASEARVYDVSGRRPTPLEANLSIGSRAADALKRARRRKDLENSETDLIQEFAFPTVSNRIKLSADGKYIFASGTYPPQIHVYDTDELSLKFKRHVNNDIVNFQILEADWRKFALLTADRYIDLQSPFGSHFKTRVPKFGRDLMLHQGTCDLYVCGDGADVWRLNLDQGRFMTPLPTRSGSDGGNNVCGINPVNSLLAFGGETALLDIWDPRVAAKSQKPAATLNVAKALRGRTKSTLPEDIEISALRFDKFDGVSLGVGTSTGHTMLFDLRSPNPLFVRDQGYGLPIRTVHLHEDGKHCISADSKSIKIWDRSSGVNMAAIEPDADINDLCILGNSGVMCTAVETQRVKTYYVPALGHAPKWCAFLDTFTEELEDGRRIKGRTTGEQADGMDEVYENYKFVAHDELEGLGLGHLIGTDMLKAYMHGYFVHQKLYRRAVDVSEPFAYEKYRKEKAREKVEEQRQSRITKVKSTKRTKVAVNQKVAEELEQKKSSKKKSAAAGAAILEDNRFKAMFSNKDYAVDEEAERFTFLNPMGVGKGRRKQDEDNSDEEYLERFDLVDERDENRGDKESGDNLLSGSEDSGEDDGNGIHESDDDGISPEHEKELIKKPKQSRRAPKMFEVNKMGDIGGLENKAEKVANPALRRKIRKEVSLGSRLEKAKEEKRRKKESEESGRRGHRRRRKPDR